MRTKKVFLNFITDFIPQILLIIIGIYKSKVMLASLGQEKLGLYQIFGQLMAYLSLVEGGLTSAALFYLYKPLIEKNNEKIAKILNGIKKIFSCIAIVIFGLGIAISFIIPFLIKDNPFELSYIQMNFTIFLISEVIFYFSVYSRVIFEADEKKYKINLAVQAAMIIKGICEILILLCGGSLTQLLLMFVALNLILNTIIMLMAKKEYAYLPKTKEADFSLLKDVKHLIVHKIGSLIAGNIDMIILLKVKGLADVVVYSTYNYIVNSLRILVDKIYSATMGSIGNLLASDRTKSLKIFKEYNAFVFFLAAIIAGPLYLSIDNFINILYEGQIKTSGTISLMFILCLIYGIVRNPIISYISAAGMFKETKFCPLLESIINLVLSLILVNFFGVAGLLFATFISLIISEYMIKPIILYKKVFKVECKSYYLSNFKYIILIIMILILNGYFKNIIVMTSLFDWLISSGFVFIVNTLIVVIYFIAIKDIEFLKRIKNIITKKGE